MILDSTVTTACCRDSPSVCTCPRASRLDPASAREGYDVPYGWEAAARGEPDRPAELSLSGFLTTRFLDWLDTGERMVRPPQLFASPSSVRGGGGVLATVRPRGRRDADCAGSRVAATRDPRRGDGFEASAAPSDPDQMRALKTQYYGMISEVDSQLGRVVRALEERGEWEDTLVVITADHGEQLGDHGLKEKLGFFLRATTSSVSGAIPTPPTPAE